MREILFRGKDVNGNWHEGFIRQIWSKIGEKERFVICPSKTFDNDGWTDIDEIEIIPETLGQFTGLTDKNGVKIFEGDIVKGGRVLCNGGFDISNYKCIVKFESGMFKCGSMSLITFSNRCVIIGNIHDNPELLNQ